jgi:hypothetical protein
VKPAVQPAAQGVATHRRPVNWRSVLLGLAGVVFICGLTPYNDYVVNNTNLVGSHMPTGALLFFLVIILLVNAPLWKWAPRQAMRKGELAVALGMMLVSCALPSVALMRQLPGHLTALFYHSANDAQCADVMRKLDLPDWIFPTIPGDDARRKGSDPIVRDFVGRAYVDQQTFASQWWAVPWRAWWRPAATWGVLLAFMFGAILCMSMILRRQWAESERLPFPLASVWLSLIEDPPPGSVFKTCSISPASSKKSRACAPARYGSRRRSRLSGPPLTHLLGGLTVYTVFRQFILTKQGSGNTLKP